MKPKPHLFFPHELLKPHFENRPMPPAALRIDKDDHGCLRRLRRRVRREESDRYRSVLASDGLLHGPAEVVGHEEPALQILLVDADAG